MFQPLWLNNCGKQFGNPSKISTESPYNLEIPPLDTYLKELETLEKDHAYSQ